MDLDPNEEKLLRAVALQNARAVMLARDQAEQGLLEAKKSLEQKNTELDQQREWFKVALSSIGDAVITTDIHGNITFLNPVAESLTGWKQQETVGKPLSSVFHLINEYTREPVLNPVDKVLAEGKIIGLANHTALIAKDGTEFAIEDSAAPIIGEHGKMIGAVMVFHDVTQKRRIEHDLRESEERFRATFNQAAVGIAIAELSGRFIKINHKFSDILGYSADELLHMSFVDITLPEDLVKTQENVKGLLQGTYKEYAHEKRYVKKNGDLVWSLTTVTLLRDLSGKPFRFIGVIEDITTRKMAEMAIEEASEQRRLALEAAELGSWDYRLDLDTVYWDERCRNMWGISEGETVTYTNAIAHIHPEDRDRVDLAVKEAIEGKKNGAYHEEFRVVWPDKSEHWISSHGQVHFKWENGKKIASRFIGANRNITQDKKTKETILRNESELRVLANSIPQLAWMAEPNGFIFWYNQRWYEYTGTNEESMKGWGWEKVHDPAVLPQVVDRWKHSIQTGEPFEMEFPLRSANGNFRWFLTRVNPMRDEQGKVIRWFGTNTDVHHERNVREALQEEARVLELLNKTGTRITGQLELQNILQTVTDVATQISGAQFGAFFYTQKDENGESMLLYTLSGADRAAFEKFGHPRATALFGPTFKGEGIIRSDDILKDPRYGKMAPHYGMPKGHLPVRSYLAVPVISTLGEVIGGLFFGHPNVGVFSERTERLIAGVASQAAVGIDNARLYTAAQKEIEERKKAEEASRMAGERFRFLAESMPPKIFTATPKGSVEYLNQQWLDYTGLQFDELRNRGWLSVLHPDDLEPTAKAWKQSLDQGIALEIEHRFRNTAGEYRWHLTRVRPLEDDKGNLLIWIGSHTDIEDLRKTQTDLESAIKAKDEFLAILSHELRTPLTPVLMTISNLRREVGIPEAALKKLERIERNVQVEARLIDDLLDLTRISSKKIDLQMEKVDLNSVLKSALEICQAEIAESSPIFRVKVSSTPLLVMGDATRLQQVFWNLIKNAIKFSPQGGEILVQTQRKDKRALVMITDQGVGIEANQIDKIFNPFEQAGRSNFGGLGLGLAICKASVEAHGGTIEAISGGKNVGSTFTVELPLAF